MLSAALLIFPLIMVVPIAFYLAIWVAATTHPPSMHHPFRRASVRHDQPVAWARRFDEGLREPRCTPREEALKRAFRCRRMARLFTPDAAQALTALAAQFEQEARGRARHP